MSTAPTKRATPILLPHYERDGFTQSGAHAYRVSRWEQIGVATGYSPEERIADAKRQGFVAPVLGEPMLAA